MDERFYGLDTPEKLVAVMRIVEAALVGILSRPPFKQLPPEPWHGPGCIICRRPLEIDEEVKRTVCDVCLGRRQRPGKGAERATYYCGRGGRMKSVIEEWKMRDGSTRTTEHIFYPKPKRKR